MAFEQSIDNLSQAHDYITGQRSPALQFDLSDFVRPTPRSALHAPAFQGDMVVDPISGAKFNTTVFDSGAGDVMSRWMGVGQYGSPSARSMTAAPASQSYFRGDVHPLARAWGYGEDLYG